jgi:two-component system NarL family sensor kinase
MLLVKKMQVQMDEIQANRELLAQLDRQLLSTREEERARMARDLHDGPVQALIGLNIQLGLLPTDHSNDAQNIREGIKSVVYDLRAVCAELRPPMLDTLGLSASLRALVQDWSAHSGIPVHYEQNPEIDFPMLPEKVAVNLYRVAQEALSNIYRHAEAHQVNLKLLWDGDSSILEMIIQDNGKGFSIDSPHSLLKTGHMGLVNMQERLALFGGKWQIETSPGCGTVVHVKSYAALWADA